VRFKKVAGQGWKEMTEADFRKLKIGEGVKIELGTEQTKKLFEEIAKQQKIAGQGVQSGTHRYVVADEQSVIVINDRNKQNAIVQLLNQGYSEEFWETLKNSFPDVATKLSLGYLQSERQKALSEFSENISKTELEESYWQDFFEKNKWIFGYGLRYQILKQEQAQPHYGGTRVDGAGDQRGDYLCTTEGDIGFTVLVEIKKPSTNLLSGASAQRNGAWGISTDLIGGITQLQANKSKWEMEGSQLFDNQDRLEGDRKYTVSPHGILLIGKLQDVATDRDKRATFERFRQNISGLEIITFDELLKRAEFILTNCDCENPASEHADQNTSEVNIDNLPF